MFRDFIDEFVETIGPIVLKALAALACLIVFAPLLIALTAPFVR